MMTHFKARRFGKAALPRGSDFGNERRIERLVKQDIQPMVQCLAVVPLTGRASAGHQLARSRPSAPGTAGS
jgi:hypothetical protein